MTDRERVIFDIERCICHVPDACRDCSKYGGDNALRCMEDLLKDALKLLKEQEPVEPFHVCADGLSRLLVPYKDYDYTFCPYCGRKVKWDDTCRR